MKVTAITRYRNEEFYQAIMRNYNTIQAFVNDMNCSYGLISTWLNFKNYPRQYQHETQIECLLNMPIDMLFPSEYKKAIDEKLGRTKINTIEITQQQFDEYCCSREMITYQEPFKGKGLDDALDTLEPREKRVLEMRFGLTCNKQTLEECGRILQVSNCRVAQIEARALRKLRHPLRIELLGIEI